MNREQIIKALEWCSGLRPCVDCPMRVGSGCRRLLMENAISLIREQEEENELLGAEKEHLELVVEGKLKRASALEKEVLKLTEENDRLRADTVRKMAEMIEDHCIKGGIYPAFVSRAIEQVAEEILDTENDSQSVSQSVSQSTDTCVSCGNIIPEGRQVCLICEEEVREND